LEECCTGVGLVQRIKWENVKVNDRPIRKEERLAAKGDKEL